VERIDDGSKLVEQAGKTMEEIVTSVKRVTDILAEISVASQEQSIGIEQVSQTIAQMDDATQQNAALVEESSASARSLMDQGGALVQSVSRFRLQDALETSEPIVVNSPAWLGAARAAPPAVRPAQVPRPAITAAKAAVPAARPKTAAPTAKMAVGARKSSEDHENWSEF
jgi:methyl-accepting chemotaxis protein